MRFNPRLVINLKEVVIILLALPIFVFLVIFIICCTFSPSKMQKNIESPDGTIKMQRGGVSDSGGDGHIDTGDGAIGSITSCGDFGGGGHSGGDGC